MQEMLEYVHDEVQLFGSARQILISKIKEMIEKEKEVMKLMHKNGYDNSQYRHDCNYGGVEYWDDVPKPFDEFYNETFNTYERDN